MQFATFAVAASALLLAGNVCATRTGSNEERNVIDRAAKGPVQASWDNHFEAFAGQDVEKILKDYTEKSVIFVYDHRAGKETTYEGLDGARECFTGLFKSLPDLETLAAPVVQVEEASDSGPGTVLLIWSCPGCGYKSCTDTFVFDADAKILRQNVVFTFEQPAEGKVGSNEERNVIDSAAKGAVQTSWDNHFEAFGGQDVDQILEGYTEKSVIVAYDHTTGKETTYKGLEGAREFFTGLFNSLHHLKGFWPPVIEVEEASDSGPGTVFLIWSCHGSGYESSTDTFVFDADAKILRQNLVFTSNEWF